MRVPFQGISAQGCVTLAGVTASISLTVFGPDKNSFYAIFLFQRLGQEERKVHTQGFDVDELALFRVLPFFEWRRQVAFQGLPTGADQYAAYLLGEIKKQQVLWLSCHLHDKENCEFDFFTQIGDNIRLQGRSREVSQFFTIDTATAWMETGTA